MSNKEPVVLHWLEQEGQEEQRHEGSHLERCCRVEEEGQLGWRVVSKLEQQALKVVAVVVVGCMSPCTRCQPSRIDHMGMGL